MAASMKATAIAACAAAITVRRTSPGLRVLDLSFPSTVDLINSRATSRPPTAAVRSVTGAAALCSGLTPLPEIVDIPLANLEGPIDRLPESHIYFDDRGSWTMVGDDLPRLGGPSGLEPIK